MTLHDELRAKARHYDYVDSPVSGQDVAQFLYALLARHPEAGVSEGEFSGDTSDESMDAWDRYSALPANPGTEKYTPEMCEQDAFTAGFDAARHAQLQPQAPVGEHLENGVSDWEREALSELLCAHSFSHGGRCECGKYVGDNPQQVRAHIEDTLLAAGYRKAPVVSVEEVARVIAPWLSTTMQDPDDWQMTRARDIATAIKAHLLDGGDRG